MRWTKAITVLACGAVCALLSAALPLAVYPYLPIQEAAQSARVLRLPATPEGWPDPSGMWVRSRPGLLREATIRGIGIDDSWHVERFRAGWPLLMVEGSEHVELHGSGGRPASGTLEPVCVLRWHSGTRTWVVPYRPRPLQVIGNWAFWSGVCLAVPWCAGSLRRWRRRRTGRCAACGYLLSGQVRCPECGVVSA